MLACDAPLSPTSSEGGVEDDELGGSELLPTLDIHANDDPQAAAEDGNGGGLSESALVIVPSAACSPANAPAGSPPWASPTGNDRRALGRYRGSTSSVDLMRVASSPVPTAAALHHHTSASMSFDRSAAPLCPQLPPGSLVPVNDDRDELASDPVGSTLVAVKVIDFGARDGRNRAPAVAEMAFAARAVAVAQASGDSESHWRHLSRIHSVEIDHESATCRIVSEALRGGTLADRVTRESEHPEAFEEALLVVAAEVLAGLADLHGPLAARHNDLKPDNVMFVHPADAAPCNCVAALHPNQPVQRKGAPVSSPSPSPLLPRSRTGTPPFLNLVPDEVSGVSSASRGCPHAPHVKVIDFGSTTLLPLSSETPPSATLNSDPRDRDRDPAQSPPPAPPLSPSAQRGALGVMSPQRLRGEADEGGGDVWAFGVLLLQVARAGRHPFLDPPAALEYGAMPMASPHNMADAVSDQFWRLAAVLGALRPSPECVEATRRAVDAALDDSCLARSPILRRVVHGACHADSARRATLDQLHLALRGHGEK
uniref:Protein kinase domain-containing protein n=1 Tax=Neobodo designis TaxID=312471 RepID=A0A7S1LW48_NEODS|mmetsp:Transcript_29431/g.90922  ORF Transcript_29431/g.90922 Transcript_29431/m.90922 type:complete len:541 (+) Transcript_29431:238-1860(+)